MVDIFRRPEAVLPIVEDAIAIGAQYIWMQEGIVNKEAAKKAEEAGLAVIMDRCTKIDHMNLL
jgi:predicted CoA-binding protein